MATKLIRLEDSTLVEIEILGEQGQQISGGMADKVGATFDKIQPILVRVCRPINAAWKEINQETEIEQAEIELGLSFEAEGNLYITKSKVDANLMVRLCLKPRG